VLACRDEQDQVRPGEGVSQEVSSEAVARHMDGSSPPPVVASYVCPLKTFFTIELASGS
jgi:hypothetical protein